jgi:hypothetical protein
MICTNLVFMYLCLSPFFDFNNTVVPRTYKERPCEVFLIKKSLMNFSLGLKIMIRFVGIIGK